MAQRNDEHRPLLSKNTVGTSGGMKRSRRPSHLILHAPSGGNSTTGNRRQISFDTASPRTRIPRTAPCEGLPSLAVEPATGASATFPSTTPREIPPSERVTVSHKSSVASLSAFGGGSPPSPVGDTSGSNETIRGVEATGTPSIDYTEYDGSYTDWDAEERVRNLYVNTTSPRPRRYGTIRWGETFIPISPESVWSSIGTSRVDWRPRDMHGVWFTMQCFVFLLVFGVLVSMTIWKGSSTDAEFWDWIWSTIQPILISLLLSTFTLILLHELRDGLSTVVLLYLQAAILLAVTATSLALASRSFKQGSLAVRAVVLGCVTVMWGWTGLGFVRVALAWRGDCRREGEGYGYEA